MRRIAQETLQYCQAACIQMALDHFGLPFDTQTKIHDAIVESSGVVSEAKTAALLKGRGIQVRHAQNLSLSDLERVCINGGVALCVVADPAGTDGRTHMVVVHKVTVDRVHVINPLSQRESGRLGTGSKKRVEFNPWWRREHHPNYRSMAVLLLPAGDVEFPALSTDQLFNIP